MQEPKPFFVSRSVVKGEVEEYFPVRWIYFRWFERTGPAPTPVANAVRVAEYIHREPSHRCAAIHSTRAPVRPKLSRDRAPRLPHRIRAKERRVSSRDSFRCVLDAELKRLANALK